MKKIINVLSLCLCLAMLLAVPVWATDAPNDNSYTFSFQRNLEEADSFTYDIILSRVGGLDKISLISFHMSSDAQYVSCDSECGLSCEIEDDGTIRLCKTDADNELAISDESVIIASITFGSPASISQAAAYVGKDGITNSGYKFAAALSVIPYNTPSYLTLNATKATSGTSLSVSASGIDIALVGKVWFAAAAYKDGKMLECQLAYTSESYFCQVFTFDEADATTVYKIFILRGTSQGSTFAPICQTLTVE